MSAEAPAPAPAPPARPHWIVWLFAAVGLLGVVAIVILAVAALDFGRPYQPAEVAGETPEEIFTVRNADPIAGTNLIRIDIGRGNSRGSSYSSGPDDLRNILLLERTSGTIRRLLPDNSRRIERSYFLPAEVDAAAVADTEAAEMREEEAPPAYFAILVEQAGESGRLDLLVGSLASARQAYVMQGLEGVDSVWMQTPTRIGMLVREQRALFYRIVDIPSLRVVQSRRIAL